MTALVEDIDRIMSVMNAAFDPSYGEAWTRRQVEDALVVGNCHYLLISPNGDMNADGIAAGFSLSRTGFEDEELLLFAVNPEHRRRGLGGSLLTILADHARQRGAARLFLEMRRGNPAESLYRTFGFNPVGLRPNYYRMPGGEHIDAITFACDISRK